MNTRRKRAVRVISATLVLALFVAGWLAYTNRQILQDIYAAAQFSPPSDLQLVMDRVEFSTEGDRIFRASTPTLESSQAFSSQCADVIHSESDLVVGCFTGTNIHLFQIADDRLDGMVEVTAAHELLHAVYKRLSPGEKAELRTALEAEYETQKKNDPRLEERMSVYADLSEEGFVNELHSVLGTEVRNLSPSLERHFAKYFTDRSKVLDLFTAYNSYFVELEQERNALRLELTTLGAEIDQRGETYRSNLESYNSAVASLISRNERFEFSSNPSEFYALRDELNRQRAALETQRQELNAAVDTYNENRERLLELDAQAEELIRSIDSDFAPPAATI